MENDKLGKDLDQMYSRMGFLESLQNKPSYFDQVKPSDQIAMKSSYEPKFYESSHKSRHFIVSIILWVAIILGLLSLACLDFKHHILIDLTVVLFILSMFIFDFIDFTRVTIGISITFLIVSLAVEIAWYCIYVPNWHNKAYDDEGMLISLRRYEKYISWVTLGFKGLLIILLFISLCVIGSNKSKAYSTGYNSKMVVPLY